MSRPTGTIKWARANKKAVPRSTANATKTATTNIINTARVNKKAAPTMAKTTVN
jgi:hypothetical protein